jgi:hypothetical protein
LSLSNKEDILVKVFVFLGDYSKKSKITIVFDEFQEIEKIAENSINKLRSIIQEQKNISYIFSGSDSRLIEFFTDPKHPFYKFGKIINLGKPDTNETFFFLKKKFELASLQIEEESVERIIRLTFNLPYFVQLFSHELWVRAILSELNTIDIELIDQTVEKILESSKPEYENMWLNLKKNQRTTLKILCKTNQPFESSILQRHKIAQSSVQTAIESLQKVNLSGK